jgi:hypothetical protein
VTKGCVRGVGGAYHSREAGRSSLGAPPPAGCGTPCRPPMAPSSLSQFHSQVSRPAGCVSGQTMHSALCTSRGGCVGYRMPSGRRPSGGGTHGVYAPNTSSCCSAVGRHAVPDFSCACGAPYRRAQSYARLLNVPHWPHRIASLVGAIGLGCTSLPAARLLGSARPKTTVPTHQSSSSDPFISSCCVGVQRCGTRVRTTC